MILADTSIWVDHFRSQDQRLVELLEVDRICCHPYVVAEIALGSLRAREQILSLLDALHPLPVAGVGEVRATIERRRLHSRGVGFVDTALIASCLLASGTRLWTRDRRLATIAGELGLGFEEPGD